MEYLSDAEQGPKARTQETITPNVWGGIVALVKSLVSSGSFGDHFPDVCPDGAEVVGTDEQALAMTLRAEIPEIEWPLKISATMTASVWGSENIPFAPDTLAAIDFIQFCHEYVAKPIEGHYHSFFHHHHLSFDSEAGQLDFRNKINRIFSRNGVAFELKEDGGVVRLGPPGLREALGVTELRTGDGSLDQMLEESRRKFLSPNATVRKEALERLWDAWERVKSIEDPSNKKTSVARILNEAAKEPRFREMLEDESRKLTEIGNSFHIRHSEVSQIAIQEPYHIDYLFHRLFAMIVLLIKSRGK